MTGSPSFSVNLGLSAVPEVDNVEIARAITPIYNAIRNVMGAVDAYTGNILIPPEDYSQVNKTAQLQLQKTSVLFVKLSEDVTYGHILNLHGSGSKLLAQKAIDPAKPAYAVAMAAGKVGDTIPIVMLGLISNLAGLTVGAAYYLSGVSAGLITSTAGTQKLGIALSTSQLWFNP